MKIIKFIIFPIFFMNILISSLAISKVFATSTEMKAIKDLEKAERSTVAPEVVTRPRIEYNVQNLKDPFQSPISAEGKIKIALPVANDAVVIQLPEVSIQGLIWGGNFPLAIVNNKIVKVGDTIQEMLITNIDKRGLTLLFRGKEFIIPSLAAKITSHKNTKEEKDEENF